MLLGNWDDLFKYSKDLLDEDFQKGHQISAKISTTATDGLTVISKYLNYLVFLNCLQTWCSVEGRRGSDFVEDPIRF